MSEYIKLTQKLNTNTDEITDVYIKARHVSAVNVVNYTTPHKVSLYAMGSNMFIVEETMEEVLSLLNIGEKNE